MMRGRRNPLRAARPIRKQAEAGASIAALCAGRAHASKLSLTAQNSGTESARQAPRRDARRRSKQPLRCDRLPAAMAPAAAKWYTHIFSFAFTVHGSNRWHLHSQGGTGTPARAR